MLTWRVVAIAGLERSGVIEIGGTTGEHERRRIARRARPTDDARPTPAILGELARSWFRSRAWRRMRLPSRSRSSPPSSSERRPSCGRGIWSEARSRAPRSSSGACSVSWGSAPAASRSTPEPEPGPGDGTNPEGRSAGRRVHAGRRGPKVCRPATFETPRRPALPIPARVTRVCLGYLARPRAPSGRRSASCGLAGDGIRVGRSRAERVEASGIEPESARHPVSLRSRA